MVYNEKHTVDFTVGAETKNTYKDWLLVPTSRPFISPPEIQDFSSSLETRQGGKIDYYKNIIGYPIYKNRVGEIEFLIDHESEKYHSWSYIYGQVMNFLHGKYGKMILNDQPDYYYEGRFSVNDFKSNSDWSTITIGYDVGPFKKYITDSKESWLWNPFSFVDGIIRKQTDFDIAIDYGKTSEITIPDLRGVSECSLDFRLSSRPETAFYNIPDNTKLTLKTWDPIIGEYERQFTLTKTSMIENPYLTFIVYPGHDTYSIRVDSSEKTETDHLLLAIHFREGIL